MPTSGRGDLLVDTSAAVALVVADHEHHEATSQALVGRRLGLAGHAAFETYSVLTRLPAPARRPPDVVARILGQGFPATRHLSPRRARALLDELGEVGIAGGRVYDALVAAAAAEHGLPLATRDRRALATYQALDVEVELLGDR